MATRPDGTDPVSGPGRKDSLWLKAHLDPECGYVVFEQAPDFDHGIYEFLEAEGLTWEQVAAPDLSLEYLVIRVTPGDEERILGRILVFGPPSDMVFYIFKPKEV